MDTPDYQRLDRLMDARRLDLDMNWDDLALTAKISVATLRAIRRGDTDPRPITKRRIEDALRWAHGSFAAVVAGGDPTPLKQQDTKRSPVEMQRELAERIRRITADPERADMLDKFTRSIDPGDHSSQAS